MELFRLLVRTAMIDSLMEQSTRIAEQYLGSVLFVDDEVTYASTSKKTHVLHANKMMRAFGEKNILSSCFKYTDISEKEDVELLAKKADVCVLDWKLVINDPSNEPSSEDDEEDDVEGADGRGRYAIDIIKSFISSRPTTPKLICIYSAEVGDDISNELARLSGGKYSDHVWISDAGDIRISVYFKPVLAQMHVGDDVKQRIVEYGELPPKLIYEFAALHCGLLPNAMMKSIAVVRESTNLLLKHFSSNLDPAFVSHRAMCPNPDDAGELLKTIISDAFDAILSYENISDVVDYEAIENWIKGNVWRNKEITLNKKKIKINRKKRLEWQKDGYSKFLIKSYPAQIDVEVLKKKISNYDHSKLKKDAVSCFAKVDYRRHEEFAILTHQKSTFKGTLLLPMLTLGTVVKDLANNLYLLCIQQRCESVRLEEEENRKFLFLPIEKTQKNRCNCLHRNGSGEMTYLLVKNSPSHKVISIQFPATNGKNFVQAEIDDTDSNTLTFQCKQGSKYKWIFDLKESHAQKIVNDYAANLSRVGVDESEWLRRT